MKLRTGGQATIVAYASKSGKLTAQRALHAPELGYLVLENRG
jgi:hypothetical protein